MKKPTFDPGFTQQYNGAISRTILPNGSFNVRRFGATWRDAHPYLYLINSSWGWFFVLVTIVFIVVNTAFAALYYLIGIEHLKGADAPTSLLRFLNAFFFSAHTLTTVGYGNMWPVGPLANSIAAIEALVGVLAFAIATGLLFGRFSRPSARIGFSEKALIAPYNSGTSFQFRVVNRRNNNLIDVDARLLLVTVEMSDGRLQRKFTPLPLERESILFFALTWTVVHPIEEGSPLYGKSAADLERLQAEVLIMIRALDESFGQTVRKQYSYRYSEIVWGAKFKQVFDVHDDGSLHLDVSKVGDIAPTALPPPETEPRRSIEAEVQQI